MKKLSGIREEAFIKFLRTKGRLDLKAFMNPSEFGSLYREFLKTITWTLIIQELEIDAEYAGRFRNFCESEDGIEEVDLGNFNKKELNDLIKRFNAEYFQHPHEDEY